MANTDGFVLMNRRRRYRGDKKKSSRGARSVDSREVSEVREVDSEALLCTLDNTLVEVGDASYTKLVLSQLTECLALLDSSGISEIVCYGLGRFSRYRSSKCQLALLLCLKSRHEGARVHVYDPVFCPEEVQVLSTLGLQVIEANEEGKRVVQDGTTTLVYMPHCSKQLTNNFLYANWRDGLRSCILLTNSFSKIVDSCLSRNLLDTAGYILRVRPYVTEIPLENSFVYEEAFNDLSFHIFTEQDLLKVPPGFWASREEPRYSTDEVEFITAKTRQKVNTTKMNNNVKIVRSLTQQIRRTSPNKSVKDNAMLQYIMQQVNVHKETSQVLCKAREELKNLAEMYLCYLRSQQACNDIHKQYAGKGERSIKETADLVGFKLPHDPK